MKALGTLIGIPGSVLVFAGSFGTFAIPQMASVMLAVALVGITLVLIGASFWLNDKEASKPVYFAAIAIISAAILVPQYLLIGSIIAGLTMVIGARLATGKWFPIH